MNKRVSGFRLKISKLSNYHKVLKCQLPTEFDVFRKLLIFG